jgi:hypothetical protein
MSYESQHWSFGRQSLGLDLSSENFFQKSTVRLSQTADFERLGG